MRKNLAHINTCGLYMGQFQNHCNKSIAIISNGFDRIKDNLLFMRFHKYSIHH